MANEFGNISYGDTSRREDLTEMIKNISPTDTPFTSGIGHGEVVKNTYHEWQEDTLTARAANSRIEGLRPTWQAVTNPTRISNVTQIIQEDGAISGTQMAIDHAGYKNQLAYQKSKLVKQFKNDLEYNVILSTLDTGESGGARTMRGAVSFLQTVTSALGSAALDETIYNDFLELVYLQGGDIDKVFVGSWLKRKISGFTASSTKNIEASAKKLINTVSVYDGDFGVQQILKSRDLNSSGASTAKMMMIQSDLWSLGWLRPPVDKVVPMENDGGDQDKVYIRGEVTLRCGVPKGNALVSGLSNKT